MPLQAVPRRSTLRLRRLWKASRRRISSSSRRPMSWSFLLLLASLPWFRNFMRASSPGDTFLASLVVISRSRWGGVYFSGRGDSCSAGGADAVDVGRSGGDFAGSDGGRGRIWASLAAGAGLLSCWESVASGSLIEHAWMISGGKVVVCGGRRGSAAGDARCRPKMAVRVQMVENGMGEGSSRPRPHKPRHTVNNGLAVLPQHADLIVCST
jgi:hypothetical protein